ncbi:MAG TPA: BatD family protein, partial [Candidatus Eisenbacteria bacterium]|nr:BatD family protein [Candidatus Eisenbacteria bacterium]
MLTLAVALAALPCPVHAEQLTVEAELDRQQVLVGEPATLAITITAEGLDVPTVKLPLIAGLDVTPTEQSQGFSWMNGVISRSVTSTFALRANAPGDYLIPSFRVRSGKKEAQTQQLVLHVRATMPRAGGGLGGEGGPELFARLTLDRTRVYWNEGVTARFTLYSRVRYEGAPAWDPPDAPGFWTEVLGPARTGRIRVGDAEYDATEMRVEYFPTRTGRLKIGPGRVHAQVVRQIPVPDPWSALGMPETQVEDIELTTEQLAVDVVPLPKGAPGAFRGAVGSYDLDVTVDRAVVHAREPVNVATVLKGEGNLAAASDPDVSSTLPSRRYAGAASTSLERTGLRLKGERRRETSFVPERPGSFAILPVRFSWFDPEQGRYRTQVSDTITVRVLAPGSGGETLGPAAALGPTAPRRSTPGAGGSLALAPPLPASVVAWGSLFAYLGVLAGLGVRDRSMRDPRRKRERELDAIARELARTGTVAPTPARTAVLLRRAAEARFTADVEGLPAGEAAARLAAAGMPAEDAARWKETLDRLEQLAYAPPDARGTGGSASTV